MDKAIVILKIKDRDEEYLIENGLAKGAPYVFHGRTARPHCLAREHVPIDDGDPQLLQVGGDCAFPAAYAAG